MLGLQAGADANITKEQNEEFDAALRDAGVDHLLVSYHGAPHSFFDLTYDEHQIASTDAWERALSFIEHHS